MLRPHRSGNVTAGNGTNTQAAKGMVPSSSSLLANAARCADTTCTFTFDFIDFSRLRPLAERARSAGIQRFRAEIQAGNTVARRFFLGLAPTARERHRNGDVVVLINIAELLLMLD
jgi:hypothetical protein